MRAFARKLAVVFCFGVFTVGGAMGQQGGAPRLLGRFGDWAAYVAAPNGQKLCFARFPSGPAPKSFVSISMRPAQRVWNELSVQMDYSFKPNLDATAQIGAETFALYTNGQGAWVKSPREEAGAIDALRRESVLVINGTNAGGQRVVARFSLKGLGPAIDRVREECGAPQTQVATAPPPVAAAPPPPSPQVAVALPPAASFGRWVALVVGNSDYRYAPKLANPTNDETDFAGVLRRLGFDVVAGTNLDRHGMDDAIREFGRKLEGADLAVFFYAGHGLQVGGKNYLVPIDAKLERPGDLALDTVEIDTVLAQMEAEKRVNLVFLDACRDNPLARSLARSLGTRGIAVGSGLASVQSAIGTMIAYATQPDNVALDGEARCAGTWRAPRC